MKPSHKWLLLGLASGHLTLVLLGAASQHFHRLGWVGHILDSYSSLSGADNTYGFFAPEIGSQIEAKFDLIDRWGKAHTRVLETGHSHESDLRIGNILERFVEEGDDKDFQRSLSASLAASFLRREPDMTAVVVRFEEFWPISMSEYRKGVRPQWDPIYTAKFVYPPRQLAGRLGE